MISIGLVLTIACAVSAVENTLNDTNIDQRVLKRLTNILSNSNFDSRDIAALNRTAETLGLDKDLISQLSESLITKLSDVQDKKTDVGYNVYEDGMRSSADPIVNSVDESPDYASSVVLASDLLSLTSAVANVKEKVCREQGYRFLDGLLLNKRWALKSKYYLYYLDLIYTP